MRILLEVTQSCLVSAPGSRSRVFMQALLVHAKYLGAPRFVSLSSS